MTRREVRNTFRYDAEGSLSLYVDRNGNRIEKTGEQKLVGGERSHVQFQYQYDVRGQLVEEKRNGACYRYTYDGSGNRVKKESPEGSIRYGYNEKNQL